MAPGRRLARPMAPSLTDLGLSLRRAGRDGYYAHRLGQAEPSQSLRPWWGVTPLAFLAWSHVDLPPLNSREQCRQFPYIIFLNYSKPLSIKKSESCKLNFIWGKNEDCSLGNSNSDSSERLLQRSSGEGHYIRFWRRESSVQSRAYFTKGFLLVMRNCYYHEGI